MAFDENNYEMPTETEGDELPEESGNNRTFMIAIGILGGLIFISVACLALFYVLGNQGANTVEQAAIASGATQTKVAELRVINDALTATFQAAQPTATLSPTATVTPPLAPPSPTGTLDPSMPTSPVSAADGGTQVAVSATIAAGNATLTAVAQRTPSVFPSPTRLAGTGFADEYGLPGLVVMALAFVIVILFARRLRTAPALR